MKFLFHVSKELNKDFIFLPRIPKSALSSENKKIPRICVSTNIFNALRGYSILNYDDEFYIFQFKLEENDYFIHWKKLEEYVIDSKDTHECWFLNKKYGKCIGKIKILDFDYTTNINLFGKQYCFPNKIKWKWLEKYF